MNKNRKLTVLFVLLATSFISGGIALKDFFMYSPIVGWTGGIVFLTLAQTFAIKDMKEKNPF